MRGNGTPGERCARPQAASPAVFCPLLPRISPHADEVQRTALHWATRHGLLERPGTQAAFAAARFANLMSRAHPAATAANLALATDWLTAIFALDDLLEAALVAEPERMRAGIEDLLVRLPADAVAGTEAFGRPIATALADVWRRTRPRVTDEWRDRFVGHVAEYLHGTIWESGNRARNALPTVAEYLAMRRHTAATEMFFDLIEPVHAIVLPAGVLDDEDFQALRRHAGTAIGLFNDLISWRKEMAVGDLHNIVFVVGQDHGLDPAEAIGAAVAEHDAQMAAFLTARDGLAQGKWAADWAVRIAAADVGHWVRGNLDWSLESGRYPAGLDIPSQRRPTD
jgi:hypothetical protein